jgi:hypothetical protein
VVIVARFGEPEDDGVKRRHAIDPLGKQHRTSS